MKNIVLASSLLLSTSVFASTVPNLSDITYSVQEISSEELMLMGLGADEGGTQSHSTINFNGGVRSETVGGTTSGAPAAKPTFDEKADKVGKVISIAKDAVALGESVYTLVQKGKPTNTTQYAAISVVPRDPMTREYVDPFDMEGFSMPVEKTFSYKAMSAGKVVVNFIYKVMFSYGGSYNGSGKWLTNVMIVPSSVKTSYGWDFSATMKLGGIMNNGTKASPVAGAMLNMKYSINGWRKAIEQNDTIYVNGRGEVKSYNAK